MHTIIRTCIRKEKQYKKLEREREMRERERESSKNGEGISMMENKCARKTSNRENNLCRKRFSTFISNMGERQLI